MPSGPANRMEITDVDGDGRRDTAWAASTRNGGRELGIVTAAGGGDQVAISLGGPTAMWLMAADADQEPPLELFVGDTRSVQLWTFVDCALRPVTDRQGEPYVFDRGFVGTGTGAGCIDADGDGRRDLVGLNVIRSDDPVVEWSRTIIDRDGLLATAPSTPVGSIYRRTRPVSACSSTSPAVIRRPPSSANPSERRAGRIGVAVCEAGRMDVALGGDPLARATRTRSSWGASSGPRSWPAPR